MQQAHSACSLACCARLRERAWLLWQTPRMGHAQQMSQATLWCTITSPVADVQTASLPPPRALRGASSELLVLARFAPWLPARACRFTVRNIMARTQLLVVPILPCGCDADMQKNPTNISAQVSNPWLRSKPDYTLSSNATFRSLVPRRNA